MRIKNKFEFKLSDKLKEVAPHSADIMFRAERDENILDLYNISWEDEDGWGYNNYLDKDVKEYVEKGDWVVID